MMTIISIWTLTNLKEWSWLFHTSINYNLLEFITHSGGNGDTYKTISRTYVYINIYRQFSFFHALAVIVASVNGVSCYLVRV